jgi:predicted nucleotidyltransferase component of viral defense system
MIRRRIHTEFDLADLAEELSIPLPELERDFLLVSIAATLETDFPGALCLKGGFVLRHVHGQGRLSVDIDATRHDPPRLKLESTDVGRSITRAGGSLFRVRVAEPATDSGQSLDFDRVLYNGPVGRGRVAVEVSYREALVMSPRRVSIGPPFFDPFPVAAMAPEEMVAEKLRTLAQRRRPTDLSDLAFLLAVVGIDDVQVQQVVPEKFKPGLVQPGNHEARIRQNIDEIGSGYDESVRAVAPGAASYAEARDLVLSRLKGLLG